MKKPHPRIRILSIFLLSILLIPLVLNYALWLISPLGYYDNQYNLWFLQGIAQPHETGYQYAPGRYAMAGYDLTVLPDGLRFVPDSVATADCTIAFVGDSLTWGYGVSDDDTFANHLAGTFGVRVLNTGRIGYNAQQVQQAIAYYPADGYIYLHVHNDAEGGNRYAKRRSTTPPNALLTYLNSLLRRFNLTSDNSVTAGSNKRENFAIYQSVMQDIVQHPRVLMFSFPENETDPEVNSEINQLAIQEYGAIPIPTYTDYVSTVDRHPNATGHDFIAQQMRPYVEAWLPEVCKLEGKAA